MFQHLIRKFNVGKSGGLALLWSTEVDVEIQNYSNRHINAKVCSTQSNFVWKLTGFYGHPEASKRIEAWQLLRFIARMDPSPWICLGDFNEILSLDEKFGGNGRQRGLMENFQMALEESGLSELGYVGPKFTWNNGQEGADFIKERLDRVVANKEWCEAHPNVEVVVRPAICSDHSPLWVFPEGHRGQIRRPRIFRFEAEWETHKKCRQIIEEVWKDPSCDENPWRSLFNHMEGCKNNLLGWQLKDMGRPKREFEAKCKKLASLQGEGYNPDVRQASELQRELQGQLEQEELRWRQRAKMNWLVNGDRNSKYFHACANQRRKANTIKKIRDESGCIWETQAEIGSAFETYFKVLFSSGGMVEIEDCLGSVEGRISEEMNESLVRPFVEEEVRLALFQMAPMKAPGPDGFNEGFFQKNWDVVGPEVCKAVLFSLNNATISNDLNSTFIALIPKVKNPTFVTDFRPISLCNVIYKIISKVLANRLKIILPQIISPFQSAFIPGRLISDNILAAYETLHTMQTRLRGKKGYMAVKVDMSKAYDRVEWGFLEAAMRKLGFAPHWIKLVMMCVSSVHYEVLVNGIPTGKIIPSRGIRQGDPISPYLFLICAEVLSAMLSRADRMGVLEGVPTSRRGPRINHLFFADDSLLFCRADGSHRNNLSNILHMYERASGQRLNSTKTAIYFSRNTTAEVKQQILDTSGIPSSQRYDKYLGLPALVGKSRIKEFKCIIDKVWKRLQDWKLKLLSQAGREILLKAVVQAIPTYCMSVFLLPKTLCQQINTLMQKFWWGTPGIHWMKWSKMGISKSRGGMGFRDFLCFNKALLAKQSWHLWQFPDNLASQIIKGKYYANGSILEAKLGSSPSYAWRSILGSRDLFKDGLWWRIGNGNSAKIWGDKWVPIPSTFEIYSPPQGLPHDARVVELMDEDLHGWNRDLVETLFSPEEAQAILSIPINPNREDARLWKGTKNGLFTVRSAYHLAKMKEEQQLPGSSNREEKSEMWSALWRLPIPNAEKNFLWRACHEILPTKVSLQKRKVVEETMCPICNLAEETCFHILWDCPSARDVWSGSLKKFQKSSSIGPTFRHVAEEVFKTCDEMEISSFVGIARRIWFRRNEVIHGGCFLHPTVLLQQVTESMKDFVEARNKSSTANDVLTKPGGGSGGCSRMVALTATQNQPSRRG
jgi:hypothetical protein